MCEKANLKKCIFISSTSIFTKLNANTKKIKLKREELIKNASLNYTIIRPTMIYGLPNDGNMSRLIKLLSRTPVMPIFGTGEYLHQPVTYNDLADAVLLAVKKGDVSNRQEYNISGKTPLTYNQVIDYTATALGRKILKLHIPHKMSVGLIALLNKFGIKILKVEQIERLNEDKSFSYEKAKIELGYSPVDFVEGIKKEVQLMNNKGVV